MLCRNPRPGAVPSESKSVVRRQRVRCGMQRLPVLLLYVVSNVPLRAVSSEFQSSMSTACSVRHAASFSSPSLCRK